MEYRLPQGFPQASFESIQGRRWNMEDAHVNIDDLSEVYPDLPKSTHAIPACASGAAMGGPAADAARSQSPSFRSTVCSTATAASSRPICARSTC